MTVSLLACVLVTLAALFYVFYLPGELHLGPEKTRLTYLRERKDAVYENLRDLNFEYKAGKFPDADYQSMKTSLEEEAAAILAEIARLEEAAARCGSDASRGSRWKRGKGLKRVESVDSSDHSGNSGPAVCCSWLPALASAQTLTGTVTNGTTDKPAAGDDVILIKLAQGMEEAARTKTDAQGKFSFKLDDGGGRTWSASSTRA